MVLELGLWMLAIALLPLGLAVYVSNTTFDDALGHEVRARLDRIASESTRRIETYVNGLIVDIGLVAEDGTTVQALGALSRAAHQDGVFSPAYQQQFKRFDGYLSNLRTRKNWADVLLVDQRGEIVYSSMRGADLGRTLSDPSLAATELASSVSAANTLLQSEVSNFSYYPPAKVPAAFLAAPILDDGLIVGDVVVRIAPEDLQGILGDVSGLGTSGEVLAGAGEGKVLHLVAPARHRNPLPTDPGEIARRFWPLTEALLGHEGSGNYVDYRGVPTVAVWRYVPSLNWAMVAKIDKSEVYAASTYYQRMSVVIIAASLLFVALATYLSYRSISRPVVRLAALVGSLTGDHLPTQLPILARNEIGILIDSFNRLIWRLREHQVGLERKVRDRTAELQRSEDKLTRYVRTVDEHVPTITIDADRIVRSVSNAFCRLSDSSRSELIGRHWSELLHDEVAEHQLHGIWSSVGVGYTWKGELRYRKRNGGYFWTDEVITPTFDGDRLQHVTAVQHDITDRKRVEVLSITDELTGLYNRRHLNAVFEREAAKARRAGRSLGLLLFDVDYFKRYNDRYGHQAGDAVLQRLSEVTRRVFRGEHELAFRLGGEEFGVLAALLDRHALQQVGEDLVRAIASLRLQHEASEGSRFITISAGAALIAPGEACDLDDLYLRADQALYAAKQTGRDRLVCWVPTAASLEALATSDDSAIRAT